MKRESNYLKKGSVVERVPGANATGSFILPSLHLTDKEKIEQYGSVENWGIECVYAIDGTFNNSVGRFIRLANDAKIPEAEEIKNYNTKIVRNLNYIRHGIFYMDSVDRDGSNPSSKNSTTYFGKNMYELDENSSVNEIPIPIEHFDKLANKLRVIHGERTMMPPKYQVTRIGSQINKVRDEINALLIRKLAETKVSIEFQNQLAALGLATAPTSPQGLPMGQQDAGIATPNGQMLTTPDAIKKYIKGTVKDLGEVTANNLLKVLEHKLKLRYLTNQGFKTNIATDSEVYAVNSYGSEIKVREVDLQNFTCALSNNEHDVSKAAYWREVRYLTPNEILSEYWQELSDADEEDMEHLLTEIQSNNLNTVNAYNLLSAQVNSNGHVTNNYTIRVAIVEWVAYKKIGLLSRVNEFALEELIPVDEEYKKKEGEKIKWVYVPQTWRGIKIGQNFFIPPKPIQRKYHTLEDLGKMHSSYVGYMGTVSLVDLAWSSQKMINITIYHLILALIQTGGKVTIWDMAQMPKSLGLSHMDWMKIGKLYGVMLINSLEKNEDDRSSSFNQFQSLDMNNSQALRDIIGVMQTFDNMLSEITGITPQREGATTPSETLGGVERSVTQSSASTAWLNYIHDMVIADLYNKVINEAKQVYSEGTKINYQLSEQEEVFLEITNEFLFSDFNIVVSNFSKDKGIIQQLQQFVVNQLQQNIASVDKWIAIMRTDSLAEAESIASIIEEERKEAQQQQQQHEQEMQQMQMQQAQAQQQVLMQLEQVKMQLEQAKLDLQRYEIDIKAETERYKADKSAETLLESKRIEAEGRIVSYRMDAEIDGKMDGQVNRIEQAKLQLEQGQLSLDVKRLAAETIMQDKDIALKEKEMQHKERLARQTSKNKA